MLLLRLMLGSVLLLLALPGLAETLPELLKPVDPAVQAKLMANTNYDFRLQRYAAKRFRIVDIDWALLNQEGARFTISPFNEPGPQKFAVTVRTLATARDVDGPRREWVGEVENSGAVQHGPNGKAFQIPDRSFALWVTSGLQTVTLKAARKVAAETGDMARFGMLPEPSEDPDAPLVVSKLDLNTVMGMWLAAPGAQIVLKPIADDPRYHVVYLVDQDKMPAGVHGGEVDAEKQRAKREFFEQLQKERKDAATKKP